MFRIQNTVIKKIKNSNHKFCRCFSNTINDDITVLYRLMRFKPLKANYNDMDGDDEDDQLLKKSNRIKKKRYINNSTISIEDINIINSKDDSDDIDIDNDYKFDQEVLTSALNNINDELENEGEEEEFVEIDDEEMDPSYYISRSLLTMGKVSYKHTLFLPDWLYDKQEEICSYRTKQQIRRCLRDWMIQYDREIQTKYRKKQLKWNQTNHNNIATATKNNTTYNYGPEETVAYSFYYMPGRFSIATRILKELQLLLPSYLPYRTLDFGCGPGTVAAALNFTYEKQLTGNNRLKYLGIDKSQSMIDAANIMVRDLPIDSKFYNNTSTIINEINRNSNNRYDLAIATYTLSTLESDEARRIATQLMFEALDLNGIMIIIEQGNPEGSHTCRTARQFILDTFNNINSKGQCDPSCNSTYYNDKDNDTDMILPPPGNTNYNNIGAYVIAPCSHDQLCPLKQGSWCSFSQKVYSGVIRKGSEEKFSYVVIQKRLKVEDPAISSDNTANDSGRKAVNEWLECGSSGGSEHPSPQTVLNRFMGVPAKKVPRLLDTLLDEVDWEEYNPPLRREEWGRIIRAPMKQTRHMVLDLCVPEGTIVRSTLSKGGLLNVPSLYTALRKTTWGGLFPVSVGDNSVSPFLKDGKKGMSKSRLAVDSSSDGELKDALVPVAINNNEEILYGSSNSRAMSGRRLVKQMQSKKLHQLLRQKKNTK